MLQPAYFASAEAEAALSPLIGHVPGHPLRVNPINGLIADQLREAAIILGAPPASAPPPKAPAKAPAAHSEG
jgi:hypothetical protein